MGESESMKSWKFSFERIRKRIGKKGGVGSHAIVIMG